MSSRIAWWLLGPVVLVSLLCVFLWAKAKAPASTLQQSTSADVRSVKSNVQQQREYVLEVIGLGVTLDRHRQSALWGALQKGNTQTSIREQDKQKYPWSADEKSGIYGSRGGSSLENGAQYTPMYYAVPTFNAEAPILDPELADTLSNPNPGLVDGAGSSGLHWHLFVVGPRLFSERPDRILEQVFQFFDKNPDVPYVVLNADDGMEFRNSNRLPGTPSLLRDGRYVPEMPDASALFVLARRERVDSLRPFTFDDISAEATSEELNRYGVARRLFLEYVHLMRSVHHPRKGDSAGGPTERQPLISEWLPVAAEFAKRPALRRSGVTDSMSRHSYHIPKDWKPTPWFPIPWNKEQLADFDKLPTLGFIHRPTYVKFTDEHGKPLTRDDKRAKALQNGWDEAMKTLPESERAKAPALVVAATDGNAKQLITLHSVLRHQAASGSPEIQSNNSSQFIDTDKRLGNTGAATLFMQMAIGVMGSYRTGGISAAVNLRDKDEASIVFISPPSEEKRKTQTHPSGRADVFAHHSAPAIDPANYQQP